MRHHIPNPVRRLMVALLLAIVCSVAPASVSAGKFGSGTYGSCQYGSCSLTISSSGTVSLAVTPTAGGSCTVQNDSVSVLTGNSSGFNLTLIDNSINTALTGTGGSISALGASQASPAVLTANKWGYRVDNLSSFGTGPTSAQTNVSPGPALYAGVPASNGTAATLANTNSAANPAVITNVWYGSCANTATASGTYSSQVTYTALTN